MALYAFDGTWNTEKTKDSANNNTNVVRFKNAYQNNTGKEECYVPGIGHVTNGSDTSSAAHLAPVNCRD